MSEHSYHGATSRSRDGMGSRNGAVTQSSAGWVGRYWGSRLRYCIHPEHLRYFKIYLLFGTFRGKSIRSWWDGLSDRSFMVDPLGYFSFQPVLHNWCNKGCGMCYPVCGMMHIKEPLLLIAICLMPYNHK